MKTYRSFWQLCPAVVYTVWFLLRVQGLAARHLDEEVFIPAAVCLLGGIWLLLALTAFGTGIFSDA